MERVFRLPDSTLAWDSVDHRLGSDGQLHVTIRLAPVRPYRCDLKVEELELVPADDEDQLEDTDSVILENGAPRDSDLEQSFSQ